jgi:hypothetical protein
MAEDHSRSAEKFRRDMQKLNNLTGKSPGEGEVRDLRAPRETKPLSRNRKPGFGERSR